ncbi:CHAT domain-containing protein [Leptolyngbyaceae cyanobacterium CCMR0082]|uniref:CHAT domain-containing protein n=1 Tax=Adonisia turfae CCMR0082 TaxID=2304604 RepID=A0A6M0S969_9CYAN|nr:CHAT domain-containing protein [Adonisia turfae]NEZ65024.1 CHAT domain-containing protein [Adonisia turfae CCMR0082]
MEVLTKVTAAFALIPVVGSGIIISTPFPLQAQTIVPTSNATQATVSEPGIIDISGGNQAGSNLFHSFEQFNLDQHQTANFLTTSNTHTVIGQVIGGTASNIDGLLQVTGSNADLYLVNPAGLLFGPNARLDLGGSFTATTATHLGTDDQWFEIMGDPDYSTLVTPPSHFGFSYPSTIINQGQLTVREGHSLRLLASQVTNTGTLSAPDGEITLLATEPGQSIRLAQMGGLLSLEISTEPDISETLPALITGGDFNHSNELVIGNDGTATLIHRDIANNIPTPFSLQNAGNISTQGITGGEINLLGNTIQVLESTLNASGHTSGGSIRIGGDYQGQGNLPHASQTEITATTSLVADATQGHGGQVIVWSDGTTVFDGSISAQSATGHGGLVETSGLHQLTIGDNANVTTTAPYGDAGIWLIDPIDLTVIETGGTGGIVAGTNDVINSSINASTIVSSLNSTNVTLQASNSITLDAAINASGNSSSRDLFIDTNTLNLNEKITLKGIGELSGSANTVNVGANGSIQNAVDAVTDGGTVNLAATTYREPHTITLNHSLNLVGQGQASTFISGDVDNNGIGDQRVFDITSNGDNININNLTIQDGSSTSDGAGLRTSGNNVAISHVTFTNNEVTSSSQDGGAIQNRGSLILSNTIFDNNRSASDGGAIDIAQGSVTVVDSTFNNNQAGEHAGAIDVDPNGIVSISNTDFSDNRAGTNGGAIFSEGALSIDTAYFTENRASDAGGAIFLDNDGEIRAGHFMNNMAERGGGLYNQGELTLVNSTVANNQATGIGTYDGGGGILNTAGGEITIDATLISNNLSAKSGGGILNLATDSETEIAIANSAIVGNQAATLGGGIEIASDFGFSNLSQVTITNSTISGNQAIVGGGLRTVGPTTLTNVTVAANIATTSGGGISENLTTLSTPELINTIVANNLAPTNPDIEGEFSDLGNNLIGIDQGSTGFVFSNLVGTINTPLQPRLTPLNNTLGNLPSHQLHNDSPAANTGHNSAATINDQHGNPRIIGGIIDIGAVESNIVNAVSPLLTETEGLETNGSQPQNSSRPISGKPQTSPVLEQLQPPHTPAVQSIRFSNREALIQAEKPFRRPLNPRIRPTHTTTTNGRLQYFDESAFQHLEDALSNDYVNYWQLPQTQPVTLQSVQNILNQANHDYKSKSAVIYAVFVPPASNTEAGLDRFALPRTQQNASPEDQLLLILVSATGDPVQQLVDVSRAELTQQAKLFRLAVSDPEDPLSYKALARQMYDWLLAPLTQDLEAKQIDHVMYSLDQGLRTIPLAAMMQEDTFIIEEYGVSLIPSMGLIQHQFDNTISVPRSLVAGANQFEALDTLPAVPLELDVVAQSLQTREILLNETFTLDNFLKLKTSQQPELLHLATHAEFNAGNLEQSFIQFWDTPLNFHQMKTLSWPDLELLILSACGTALSSPEAELGFIGLAAAAGIETSIGSLWNVSDIGTLALMTEFYHQLPHTTLRHHSLQRAQISLITGATHINNNILYTSQGDITLPVELRLPTTEFSHPFYWAGFTMVGNPWY